MNERTDKDQARLARIDGAAVRTTGLSGWLIRHAARTAPEELAARLEEEWLSDLDARSSPISRLRFALGCAWATRIIVQDHSIVPVPVGASAWAGRAAAGWARGHRGPGTRRTTTFGMVAILHVGVFYALMTGLSNPAAKTTTQPLQNQILDPARPRPLPLLAPPDVSRVKVNVPKLVAVVEDSPDETPTLMHADSDLQPVTPPGEPPPPISTPPVRIMQGGPGNGFPVADDFYPSAAKRLGEEGSTTVRVCVDASGRLTAAPTLVGSSGSARLDEGAMKLAAAGSGHYRAATEDGRAVNSCFPFRIRFQIRH
jgi:protein TonB